MKRQGEDQPARTRRPSSTEQALWRLAMRDTVPLTPRAESLEPVPVIPEISETVTQVPVPVPVTMSPRPKPKPLMLEPLKTRRGVPVAGLDRRTSERLRKGQLPIEARIDLHGMTQDRARDALDRFVAGAADRGLRAILVITGKGASTAPADPWQPPRSGVLRANVPRWLNELPNRPRILAITEAQPQDGGGGALYVLLRRQRQES